MIIFFFLRNYQKLCSSWCSSPIKHVFVVYKPLQPLSASPGRLLVDHVDEWFSLFFIIYRCVVGFSPEILGDWISTFSDRTWIEWVIWVIWRYESGTIQCQELLNLVGGLEHLFNIFQRGCSTTSNWCHELPPLWVEGFMCSGKAQTSGSSDAESAGQMYFFHQETGMDNWTNGTLNS